MNPDPIVTELDSPSNEPVQNSDHQEPELDPLLVWAPSGRRLISGLLGLNVVLLGAALVAGEAFNPTGLKHHEPQVFMLLLLGVSLVWLLWYLLWARRQPDICPHKDHHAGGITVTGELQRSFITTDYKFVLDLLLKLLPPPSSGPDALCCLQSAAVRLQDRLSDQYEGLQAGC